MPSFLPWSDLTTVELSAMDKTRVVAILPVAATEQHGPHLPLGTDSVIMRGYLDAAAALAPADDVPALVLPIQTIGCSLEHTAFSGTLSLSAATALAAWGGLVADVARAGLRRLVVVNSHGGNSPVLDILAQEARARHAMLVVTTSWQRLGYPDGLFADDERRHGIHGGAIETALMLAFRPDLVRHAALADFVPASVAIEAGNAQLRPFGRPSGFGWMAQDLRVEGVMGDARAGTAEAGRAAATHGAAAFVTLLREVAAFDLAGLRDEGREG